MDINGLLQALPTDPVCEDRFREDVMAIFSDRIDPRMTNLRALRLSLQAIGRDDIVFLGVSEMIAVWMIETTIPDGHNEGLELLRWLSNKGLISAKVNYACAVLNDRTRTTEHPQAFGVLAELKDQQDLPLDLHSEVLFALGTCCIEGAGTEKSPAKASDFLFRSSNSGNARATYNLGVLCGSRAAANASGAMPNFRLAAHYLSHAAEQGNVRAMCDLAHLHLLRCAPGSTEDQGAHFLRLAYSSGYSQAGAQIKSLEQASGTNKKPEDWAQVDARALLQAADAARVLHHCNFSLDPTYWFLCPPAHDVRDEISAIHITTLLVRARSRGYLTTEQEFQVALDRLDTPKSREALINDNHFWRRLNTRA